MEPVERGEPSSRTIISAALYQSGLYGTVARQKPLLSTRHMCHIFQPDNDLKHTAKITKERLQDNSVNVPKGPSQTPYLNLERLNIAGEI